MENVRRIGFAVNRADDTVGKIVEEVGEVVSGSLKTQTKQKNKMIRQAEKIFRS